MELEEPGTGHTSEFHATGTGQSSLPHLTGFIGRHASSLVWYASKSAQEWPPYSCVLF